MATPQTLKAQDVMSCDVVTVSPDDSIRTAVARMLQHHVSGLPVADRFGQLVGMISEYDLLDLIWDGDSASSEVYQYMVQPVHTVEADDDLNSVAEQFRLFGMNQLPVMRDERMVGIISRQDLLARLCQLRVPPLAKAA